MKLDKQKTTFKGLLCAIVALFLFTLLCADILRVKTTQASVLGLPEPTECIAVSNLHSEPMFLGMRIDPKNPMSFEFFIDSANASELEPAVTDKLVKYFLAGLTVANEDLWVNLSPYEKDRILPDVLSKTELGKELLAQDYVLKQLSSSLTHPDTPLGQTYWDMENRNSKSENRNKSEIRNSFNKIWITPGKIKLFENNNGVFITEANLKVKTEKDYLAASKNKVNKNSADNSVQNILLPEIEEDVNHGKNFASLRQVYRSLILATWFKEKFRKSFFRYYIEKNKINEVELKDPEVKDKIYNLYCEAFKKGVYNIIKSEKLSSNENKKVKRHYFSGGVTVKKLSSSIELLPKLEKPLSSSAIGDINNVHVNVQSIHGHAANGVNPDPYEFVEEKKESRVNPVEKINSTKDFGEKNNPGKKNKNKKQKKKPRQAPDPNGISGNNLDLSASAVSAVVETSLLESGVMTNIVDPSQKIILKKEGNGFYIQAFVLINGKSAGWFTYKESKDKIYLERLNINPEFQQQGIGHSIMYEFMKEAFNKEKRLLLETSTLSLLNILMRYNIFKNANISVGDFEETYLGTFEWSDEETLKDFKGFEKTYPLLGELYLRNDSGEDLGELRVNSEGRVVESSYWNVRSGDNISIDKDGYIFDEDNYAVAKVASFEKKLRFETDIVKNLEQAKVYKIKNSGAEKAKQIFENKLKEATYSDFNQLVDKTIQDGNVLAKSIAGNKIYNIPGINEYIVKVNPLASKKEIKAGTLVFKEDIFSSANIGQRVAVIESSKSSDLPLLEIRKKNFGESNELIAKKFNKQHIDDLYESYLLRNAQMPQEAYNNYALLLKELNNSGIKFDPGVGNGNILVDLKNESFNLVDQDAVVRRPEIDKESFASVVNGLIHVEYARSYGGSDLSVLLASFEIFTKSIVAAKAAELGLPELNPLQALWTHDVFRSFGLNYDSEKHRLRKYLSGQLSEVNEDKMFADWREKVENKIIDQQPQEVETLSSSIENSEVSKILLDELGLGTRPYDLNNNPVITEIVSAEIVSGLLVYKVKLNKQAEGLNGSNAALALAKELNTQCLDLVYDSSEEENGKLLALFRTNGLKTKLSHSLRPFLKMLYVDLSPFYYPIAQPGEKNAYKKWLATRKKIKENQKKIQSYIKEQYGNTNLDVRKYEEGKASFVYLEIDKETGKWKAKNFNWLLDLRKKENKHQIILPLFPSVYSPGYFETKLGFDDFHRVHYPVESKFYEYIYKHSGIDENSDVYAVGPGFGPELWASSLLNNRKQIYTSGINPLEIAATKASAKIAGFDLKAKTWDNIKNKAGELTFPDKKFDHILWSMTEIGNDNNLSTGLSSAWNGGDMGAKILEQFLRALPDALNKDGKAIVYLNVVGWDIPTEQGKQLYPEVVAARDKLKIDMVEKYISDFKAVKAKHVGGRVYEITLTGQELTKEPVVGISKRVDDVIEEATLASSSLEVSNKRGDVGGIDLNDMSIETSSGMFPVEFVGLESSSFSGFSFKISKIEEVEDIDSLVETI